MDQIKVVGGLLMTAVFAFAVVMFAINFANENNSAFNIDQQPGYNDTFNNLNGNLSQYQTETVNASDSFYRSEISTGDTVTTGGQFKLGPGSALKTTDNILQQGFKSIFGSSSSFAIVFSVLITFLGYIVVLVIWKTWKGGNPG